MAPHSSILAWKIPWTEEPGRLQSMGSLRVRQLSDFTFTFHFHALEKEMATHSSVLAWRIPGTGGPGGLLSMGSHRVGHDWNDLAVAGCSMPGILVPHHLLEFTKFMFIVPMMLSSHLILWCSLLLLPSVFPSIRGFSNEASILIRLPKYWSFSISPCGEYSGLISLKIHWFNLLAV